MLFNLLRRKRRITSENFALLLWRFSCLGSLGLYDRLKPQLVEMGYELSREEDSTLFRETVIANLWAVHRSLPADKNVLRSLHQIVTSGRATLPGSEQERTKGVSFNHAELCERYEKYDGACDENSGGQKMLMLSVTMLECMLPTQRAWLDCMLGFAVVSHIANSMKAIMKLRTAFNITD
jgi:hypothetical protein